MRATVSDIKHPVYSTGSPGVLLGFTADLRSVMNYYSFGSPMPGRCGNSGNYRYGFNTQEKDDEIYGSGNSYTAEYWQYDSRLGRRWNVDPVVKEFESPYATFRNNPLYYADPAGLDGEPTTHTTRKDETLWSVAKKQYEENGYGDKTWGDYWSDVLSWNADGDYGQVGGTMYLSDPTIVAPLRELESTPWLATRGNSDDQLSDFLSGSSTMIGFLSISAGTIEHLGGLEKATELIAQGKFEAIWNNTTKQWSLKFYGSQYVPAEYVMQSKSAYAMKAASNARILNVVKAGGVVLTVGGAGISTVQFVRGDIGPAEFGADIFFTGVAIWGGPAGWIASSTYFVAKYVFDGKPTLKSNVGGYDLSNQQIMRHPHMVPKR